MAGKVESAFAGQPYPGSTKTDILKDRHSVVDGSNQAVGLCGEYAAGFDNLAFRRLPGFPETGIDHR